MTQAMKWHKRYQRAYTEDTRHLDLETRGAFQDCLDYIYEHETPIPLDDKFMAHFMHVSERKWVTVRGKLVADGKLIKTQTGYINPRAEEELADRNQARSNKSAAAKKRESVRAVKVVPRATQARLNDGSASSQDRPEVGFSEKTNEINVAEAQTDHKRPVEIEKEKERNPLPPSQGDVRASTNWNMEALKAYQAWNETALRCGLPQAAKLTGDRTRRIVARLKDYGLDGWMKALGNVEKSSFLTGGTDAGFRADLDFICQAKSFGKLHDGGYGNGRHAKSATIDELRPAFEKFAKLFAETGQWAENPNLGTPPGTPGCRVPPDILSKFNLPIGA